jgi:hypothetical protein
MPFILDEDEGLKSILQNLSVTDEKNARRRVGVWFGMPDPEVRQRAYPFITVDLINLAEDATRQMAGPYTHTFPYTPEVFPAGDHTTTYQSDLWPEAYTLTYQVGTWARNPRHDRQLLQQLLDGPLPLRWGVVPVGTGAAATMRRLDVRLNKRDGVDHDGKRLFRNVFTCAMSSELFFWQVQAVKQATTVVIDSVSITD